MTAEQAPAQHSPLNWAVVTPSYNLDFERCRLLCRSMDAFFTGPWHHYIIVDPVDLKLFQPLAGPRRTIINKKDILPKGFHYGGKVPFMRLGRWWWSFRHGPVFGWQMQQFVKIFMANHLTEEAILFCDSDLFFLKPFDISSFTKGSKVRFNLVESAPVASNPDVVGSITLMGVDPEKVRNYWGEDQLVTWHRRTVVAMQDFITRQNGKPWHEAIGKKINFAEYHLYGTYVLYVDKGNPDIFMDFTVHCKTMWSKETAEATTLRDFCADLQPHEVAVCVQSLIGADIASSAAIVDEAIAANPALSGPKK